MTSNTRQDCDIYLAVWKCSHIGTHVLLKRPLFVQEKDFYGFIY